MSTPPQVPAAPAAGGGGSLVAKLGGTRNAAILGAGLTVAAVALLTSMRGKSGATTLMSSGDFDSSPYDMWNAWQSEYEDLQQQINGTDGTNTAGTNTAGGGPPITTLPAPAPIPKPPVPPPAPKPPAPNRHWPPPKKTDPKVKRVVVVHKGDTLSKIAKSNGVSMTTLRKLNPVYWTNKKYRNGNLIWAGDKVRVK